LNNWVKEDDDVIKYARVLAADAVQKAGHGHPGTAMSLAPVAYLLFQRHLVHDPADPKWIGRDRFVLSCGHSSLTLYTQLFLSGYGLELADLEAFRTHKSLTPGHPEFGHTAGVEMTTGPLGQGIATAVGMAMATRFNKGLIDKDSELFDHRIYVICSEGDLQEGVSSEASSIAGTQELGNLIVLFDENRISIEGDTHVTFKEDVSTRYRSYGWHVQDISANSDGSANLSAIDQALENAKNEKTKPSLIRIQTVIAWPAPNARNTAKSHGSALGPDEIAATKLELGLNPDESFAMPANLLAHARKVKERGAVTHKKWDEEFAKWEISNPASAKLLKRLMARELPEIKLPTFSSDQEVSTRAASGKVINAIAESMPELWGGSADLAESNNTTIENGGSFLPESSSIKGASPYGRVIHFGIREHAMGAILNGITLNGLSRAFGGTFLVFSDYMRPAVRLAALMDIPSIFVWSHDSIGLGEDGPTHQPVEHFAALRAIPNFNFVRPADANEVAVAWLEILKRNKPAGIALSRQNLPVFDRSELESASGVTKGAYILKLAKNPKVVIIATGSEVSIAMKISEMIPDVQVVSAPCLEWFSDQPEGYKSTVLPKDVLKVSIEVGIAQGWCDYVGEDGIVISLEHYGASASPKILFEEYGFGPETIAEKIKARLR
jgi:transketolase